jgi:hypothetical protein
MARRAGYLWGRLHWAEPVLLLLMAAAAAPLAFLRYLPMQDYPQHLFQAKLVSAWFGGQPVDPFYQVHLHPTYSVFYLLVWLVGKAIGLRAAGRAAVGVYFVLMYAAARRVLWWRGREEGPAYAAFLIPALAINQAYWLGLLNFLYTLPLVLVAWMDVLQALRRGWSRRRAVLHALLLGAVMMTNVLGLLMHLVVVSGWLLAALRRRPWWRTLGFSWAVGAAWLACWKFSGPTEEGHGFALAFGRILRNAEFFALGFTGFRLRTGVHVVITAAWLAVLLVVWVAGKRTAHRGERVLACAGALALLLITLFGPFSSGAVAYVSLRMAVGCSLLLVVGAATLLLNARAGAALAGLAALLVGLLMAQQWRISRETPSLEPLIARMDPGATVLPQMIDPSSPELDPFAFQVHLHDVYLYHLEKGGVSPYLFPSRAASGTPVSYAPGVVVPASLAGVPRLPGQTERAPYRYLLIRGGNERVIGLMARGSTFVAASGEWRLYQRNDH